MSSPYVRAQQSIVPLAQRLGLPVETEPRLVERVLSAAPLVHWREALRQTFADGTQFGFQAWEHLSNPDVYCLEMDVKRVRVTRTWSNNGGIR